MSNFALQITPSTNPREGEGYPYLKVIPFNILKMPLLVVQLFNTVFMQFPNLKRTFLNSASDLHNTRASFAFLQLGGSLITLTPRNDVILVSLADTSVGNQSTVQPSSC